MSDTHDEEEIGSGNKVSRDVAERDFDRFTDAMDLDVDESRMDEDDRKAYATARGRIVRAIVRGQVHVDDKGQPVVTLADAKTVTFYEPTGASLMAVDGHKKGHDVAKMFAMLGDMTRTPAATFGKMANRDLKICQTLLTLFLG